MPPLDFPLRRGAWAVPRKNAIDSVGGGDRDISIACLPSDEMGYWP